MEKQEYINGVNFWCDLCKRAAIAVTEGESAFYNVVKSYFVPKYDNKDGVTLWSEKMWCRAYLPVAWWRHALGMDDEKKFSDADVIAESRSRFMSDPTRFSSAILWTSHVELVEGILASAVGNLYEFEEEQK